VTAGVDDNLGVLRPKGEACQLRLDRPLGPVLGPDDVLPQHGRGPGQAVPLTSQPVSTTMLSSAPSISHIVSGERSPAMVTAPKVELVLPARRAHVRLERQVDAVQREERRLRAGLVSWWQQVRYVNEFRRSP
jgi:hypothetical protein